MATALERQPLIRDACVLRVLTSPSLEKIPMNIEAIDAMSEDQRGLVAQIINHANSAPETGGPLARSGNLVFWNSKFVTEEVRKSLPLLTVEGQVQANEILNIIEAKG